MYHVEHQGFESHCCESAVDVLRHLCQHYGWDLQEHLRHGRLLAQLEAMKRNRHEVVNEDLAIRISRL